MEKKIKDIQQEYKEKDDLELPDFIEEYIRDGRPGVAKIIGQAKKRLDRLEQERQRLEVLRTYEHRYEDAYPMICGIDEVGRGPLAGPVCAAAVILPRDCEILYINDSKKLSASMREKLYDEIMEKAVATGIGMAGPGRIDEINILQATFLAMKRAVDGLEVKPDIALIDGNKKPGLDIAEWDIIKGDATSANIAAASIIAKVSRDRYMRQIAEKYPEYQFEKHKGYGTKLHYEMLDKYGISDIHRKTFLKKYMNKKNEQ